MYKDFYRSPLINKSEVLQSTYRGNDEVPQGGSHNQLLDLLNTLDLAHIQTRILVYLGSMFEILHQGTGSERVGVVKTKGGTLDTPGVLLYTQRGAFTHLTRDNAELAVPDVKGVLLSLTNLYVNG